YYGVRAYKGSSYSSYVTSMTIVRLATPTLSSVASNASGKMTVKWTAVSGVTGYLVQYSTSSSFSSCTTVKVTGATSTGKTITGLTAGTTYYVRIRTYKTVSGTNYYSGWSRKKSVAIS
ncbi:MAG: fibronectin type III domain-containing protein, partial [Clostridiales bacterium]|nr:fibronectin type III domain-containing protein [Clostridiales bacterium]